MRDATRTTWCNREDDPGLTSRGVVARGHSAPSGGFHAAHDDLDPAGRPRNGTVRKPRRKLGGHQADPWGRVGRLPMHNGGLPPCDKARITKTQSSTVSDSTPFGHIGGTHRRRQPSEPGNRSEQREGRLNRMQCATIVSGALGIVRHQRIRTSEAGQVSSGQSGQGGIITATCEP